MLKKIIPFHTAAKAVLIILSLVLTFHLLVLTGFIPFDIVWGGRLKSNDEMLVFESISSGLNLFMIFITGSHAGYIPTVLNKKLSRLLIWLMTGLFLLNTLGNIVAIDPIERIIFTPLTAVLSLFCYRMASEKV